MRPLFITAIYLLLSLYGKTQWSGPVSNVLSTNNNVSIGTTSTPSKLDVAGPLTIGVGSVNGNTTKAFIKNPAGKTWAVSSGLNMVNEVDFGIYNWTDNPSTALLNISSTGNVGIGMNNPGMKLDVNGDIRSNKLSCGILSPYLADNFTYDGKTTYNYGMSWVVDSWNTGGSSAWLSGWAGIKLFTNGLPRLAINSTGSVGIGVIPAASSATLQLKSTATGGNCDIVFESKDGTAKWDLVADNTSLTAGLYDVLSGKFPFGVSKGAPNYSLFVGGTGNVLIGKNTQTNAGYKLDVAGDARANKVVVNTTGADFVFDSSYDLRPLDEVEKFIGDNKHLPGIESAAEMQKDGLDVGTNQTKLLQKIEELTLYLIEQQKELAAQKEKQVILEADILKLKSKK